MGDQKNDVMGKAKSLDDRLAELEAGHIARKEAAAQKTKLRKIEILELEEKYSTEIGERGVDFEIVNFNETPVVVKLREAVLYKTYLSAKRDTHGSPILEAQEKLVRACLVFPDVAKFVELTDKRGSPVWGACATAIANLYNGLGETEEGK